eukprot:gene6294-7016_t
MQHGSPDCVSKPIIMINGQFPGPTIRVVENSTIEVKVVNNLATDAITIHFHGQRQFGTVWQDGFGMISSCPTAPMTSFTYRFRVNNGAGTYFYHGHVGGISAEGLYGMVIIDPTVGKPFTYDKEHSLLLSDWYHASHSEIAVGLLEANFRWSGDPQSILFNGKGFYNCSKHGVPKGTKYPYYKTSSSAYCADSQCPGYETIVVEKNKVNLIRIGNIAELSFMNIAIQGHNMTVVEADGVKIKPFVVSSLDINSGQRYAVLITADQPASSYWINVNTRHRSGVVTGQALLNYSTSSASQPQGDVETVMAFQPKWDDNAFTFAQQKSIKGLTVAPAKATRRIVMVGTQERFQWEQGVGHHDHNRSKPEQNCNAAGGRNLRWAVNGVSYRWERTPVAHMLYYRIRTSMFTENRGYYHINQGDVIDIIIQNYPACNQVCEQHPWHLHGHKFWVIGMGRGTWNGNATQVASLNTINAVYRDTTTVIPDAVKPFDGQAVQGGCGWTAVRFVADNPGVWSFHCHVNWHALMGMHAVFIESASNMPKPPGDVPICGEVTPDVYVKRNNLLSPLSRSEACDPDLKLWVGLLVGWSCCIGMLILLIFHCFALRKARRNSQHVSDVLVNDNQQDSRL